MKRTLFEIGADLRALDDLLDENGGDVTDPAVDAAVRAWFAEVAADEAAKLDNIVGLIKQLESEAETARDESRQFTRKADAREARSDWLRGLLKAHLEATNRTKAKTARGYTVAFQRNGGKSPLVIEGEVPPVYTRTITVPDNDLIRADLEGGHALPFARLGERGFSLRIR